jgi:hypothetical protein
MSNPKKKWVQVFAKSLADAEANNKSQDAVIPVASDTSSSRPNEAGTVLTNLKSVWSYFSSLSTLLTNIIHSSSKVSQAFESMLHDVRHSHMGRGRLHVFESAYESPYDSVHNLYANRIWVKFFFCHPLKRFVYTFQPIKSKNYVQQTFGSKSYTESYTDSYAKSHV